MVLVQVPVQDLGLRVDPGEGGRGEALDGVIGCGEPVQECCLNSPHVRDCGGATADPSIVAAAAQAATTPAWATEESKMSARPNLNTISSPPLVSAILCQKRVESPNVGGWADIGAARGHRARRRGNPLRGNGFLMRAARADWRTLRVASRPRHRRRSQPGIHDQTAARAAGSSR